MVWKGKADSYIWFSIFDGTSWMPACITSYEFETSDSPALAVFRDKLYLAWRGKFDGKAWYATFDGRLWSMQQTDFDISKAPALALYDDKLIMTWRDPDQQLWLSYFASEE
jgi:hypothetical protein